MTSLPASMLMLVCLFLPHTKDCSTKQLETPFDSGTWLAIAPLGLIGLLPLAWQLSAHVRRNAPEVMLMFTMIVRARRA